jgi:DEAD/DEAH box helicase domain-containing protein
VALAERPDLDELEAAATFDALAPGELLDLEPLLRLISHQRATPVEAPLVHLERLPAREARTAPLATPLPAVVQDRLGVDAFWSHQAEAVDLARAGRSVAVATGTASGKSLCYQAPIAEAVATGLRPATALLIFPTKALAQDQLRSITTLDIPRLVAATYDGDCGQEERVWARRHANVILTNPEMLHTGVLPHHDKWATFLMRLQYVVIDELHVLRGVFGTHVAHLLRRLRRLCAHYGADPTFIFSSATIGRPGQLASELCGLPVAEVLDDGSPQGERLVALWNPPRLGEQGGQPLRRDADGWVIDDDAGADPSPERGEEDDGVGARVSPNVETAALVSELVRADRRTIAFCRSRKGTEIVAADARRRLPRALTGSVRSYRGGYLAEERREIEAALFGGQLRGVVATTALELGVDVGGLDACVLNGFPGTVASFWQQAGRAGREGQESAAVLVAGQDQLDQWFMGNPQQLFSRAPEPAVINPANPFVLLPHLACAAHELPLRRGDERWWGDLLEEGVRRLVQDDKLRVRPRGRGGMAEPVAVWSGRGWPTHGVGLRNGGGREYRIATPDGELIGTVDGGRAFSAVHEGAIYLHQGRAWRVAELDLDGHLATVVPDDGETSTMARSETTIALVDEDDTRSVGSLQLSVGSVEVTSQVTGYQRRDLRSGEVVERVDLDLPPSHLMTRAFWYSVPPAVLDAAGVAVGDAPGALHAVEHAAIGMLPLFTICDRWDVGGVSTLFQEQVGGPAIVIYDGYQGGAGIAELGFESADRHLQATLEAIEGCACEGGCPSCVQSPKCGNWNEPLHKQAAIDLLHTVLG